MYRRALASKLSVEIMRLKKETEQIIFYKIH